MFRRSSEHEAGRRALEQALAGLGCEVTRWRGFLASVRRGDRVFHASLETIESLLTRPIESIPANEVTLVVGDLLGLPVDPELLLDLEPVRAHLRPRLVHARELSGPSRGLCRRKLWGDLVAGVSVGSGTRRTFVSPRQLDAWKLEFEDVMVLALENLRRVIDTSHIVDCQGARGLMAVAHEREPAAAAVLIIEDLIPGITRSPGIVWSAPSEEALLVLPVEPEVGVQGLLGIIQATYAIAQDHDAPVSDEVFWMAGSDVERLPMTWIEEGGARKVHLEAEGPIGDLLQYLGEL